jgi:hypothetical protein
MIIEPTISVGDVSVIGGLVLAATVNYITTVQRVKATDWKVEELRRGRGLILREWPQKIQQCFGYISGNGRHGDHP